MGQHETRFRWRYYDSVRQKWCTTRHYATAEDKARADGVLWRDQGAVPPWDWRRRKN